MNLCTNAAHAMEKNESPRLEIELININLHPEDPEILKSLKPGNYIKLSVKDNGTGIDPVIADKVFDPYFTTKGKKIGTGLGLATTQGIVKQHGGQISFESEPGKGACFIVYLPVYEMEEPDKVMLGKIDQVKGHGKILFVDDEQEITVIAKKMLNYLGFSVMTANSGKEALESFTKSPDFFDLMITDLDMPGMTGEKMEVY